MAEKRIKELAAENLATEKRKPGRPKGSKNKHRKDPDTLRQKVVSVRFSEKEWAIVVTSAERAGIRISEFIRGQAVAKN